MIERIFEVPALIFVVVFALVAFALGAIVGAVKGEGGRALVRGSEAAVLALVGSLLARTFVSVLLGLAGNSPDAGLAVGWAFFLWPGAVDTIAWFARARLLTTPEILLWVASGVGAFTGMMDGIWRIHNWRGLGWLSLPLDVTWGLAGSTNGCLLHLCNFAWGHHADETRTGAHRYARGFGLKPGFAFTQGAAMSNLNSPPGDPLYAHERTHVWQNRMFGPLFTLSYLGWLAVWVLPGTVAGAAVRAGVLQGAEKWCYFNNPWEAWGYAVQNEPRSNFAVTAEQRRLIWSNILVIVWAIPFFGIALFLSYLIISEVW